MIFYLDEGTEKDLENKIFPSIFYDYGMFGGFAFFKWRKSLDKIYYHIVMQLLIIYRALKYDEFENQLLYGFKQ